MKDADWTNPPGPQPMHPYKHQPLAAPPIPIGGWVGGTSGWVKEWWVDAGSRVVGEEGMATPMRIVEICCSQYIVATLNYPMVHLTPIFILRPLPVFWYCRPPSMAHLLCVAVPSPWSPMCAVSVSLSVLFSWGSQVWLRAVDAIILSLEMVASSKQGGQEGDEQEMGLWNMATTGIMSIISNCWVSASADYWIMNGVTWL